MSLLLNAGLLVPVLLKRFVQMRNARLVGLFWEAGSFGRTATRNCHAGFLSGALAHYRSVAVLQRLRGTTVERHSRDACYLCCPPCIRSLAFRKELQASTVGGFDCSRN